MTCAETRRQLPEPEPVHVASVSEHLASCPPCRVEQEALREVDRRLEQLGEHRLAAAAQVLAKTRGPSPHTPILPTQPTIAVWKMVGAAVLGVLRLFVPWILFFVGK